MLPALFDSSIYISAMRRRESALALDHLALNKVLWLSAVVLEELYAGAGHRDRGLVEGLERHFEKGERILVPDLSDWIEAGKTFASLALRYGYEKIGRSRLANDALIAMSAARTGVTIVTANARDFGRLAEFRSFQWQVANI